MSRVIMISKRKYLICKLSLVWKKWQIKTIKRVLKRHWILIFIILKSNVFSLWLYSCLRVFYRYSSYLSVIIRMRHLSMVYKISRIQMWNYQILKYWHQVWWRCYSKANFRSNLTRILTLMSYVSATTLKWSNLTP